MRKLVKNYLIAIFILFALSACNSGSTIPSLADNSQTDTEKIIMSYSINDNPGKIIDHNIFVTMPFGTDVTDLVASFSVKCAYTTVNGIPQVSGITHDDFTKPLNYLVIGHDGSIESYTVIVTIAKKSAKEIVSYSINDQKAKITDHNILVTMPFNTNVTNLVAIYSTTGENVVVNGVPQLSGVTHNNFESPVVYYVTAADGSTESYVVTVTISKNTSKEITLYSLNGHNGRIIDHNILVTMPFASNVNNLIATFSINGESATINGVPQVSGETHNDFKSPIIYIVTAADGSRATYKIVVTVPKTLFSCINDPVTSNACGCLTMNDGSGSIWYADGSKTGTWASWCSHTGAFSDAKCTIDGASLVAFNSENHCGYNNWHLPNATNLKNGMPGAKMGGEWGVLASYAKNNGWTEGSSLSKWLMDPSSSEIGENHFTGVPAQNYYWSTVSADDDINSWCLTMVTGVEYEGGKSASDFGVLLVRESN